MTSAPHDPFEAFRQEAVALLQEALHSLRWDEAVPDVPARLQPAPAGKGDFAFPCFPLAKIARKAPAEIAKEVADALPDSDKLDWVVEGPYVNFSIPDRAIVADTMRAVTTRGAEYGKLPESGTSVILEHTSANPNGPFHVGRARNPIVGDTMARVLRAAGHSVVTEYYVNDMGKQVAILAWGLANLRADDVPAADRDKIDHQKVAYYQEANKRMETDAKVAEEINASLRRFENGDEETAHDFREAASTVLQGMRESLARLSVKMDSFFWESDLVLSGDVQRVIGKLKESGFAHEAENGAWYLELESFGIPGKNTKWFFQRKDGTSLYTCRDLAYHQNKFNRADRAVNILGEDHKLAMKQLDIALHEIGEEREPDVVWISFVSLPEGKMSTRRNRVVFIDDLLDEAVARAFEEVRKRRAEELSEDEMRAISETVGIGALRFNILSVQAEKSITFRWEDALNFEGDSAPFVQYAHARAASILRKAGVEGTPRFEADALTHASEVALVKTMARLPGVVRDAADGLKVHPVTQYAVELATAFNGFYRDCPVLAEDVPADVRESRLALVAAAKQALANALTLLGVSAPDSM